MNTRSAPIRIARPSASLEAAEQFWCSGLGLETLFRADSTAEGGHALLMVGWPTAAWHLELVEDRAAHAAARPTEEDLLVIYVGEPIEQSVHDRLLECGGKTVTSPNPYWQRWGVTIEDPDGYRLVLSTRTWP
jgi:hypothetical protein